MAQISSSVGAGGTNAAHDVALVQFLLRLAKSRLAVPYIGHPYTDKYGPHTEQAIAAFQSDRRLVASGQATDPGVDSPGLVKPAGKTWKALSEVLGAADEKYGAARTTKGVSVVYLPMAPPMRGEGENTAQMENNLQAEFKSKVIQLIQRCYKESEIAWMLVPRTGGWRPFADQEGLVSDAGYGESIHQYGYAVDLTVRNFSWIDTNLNVQRALINFEGIKQQKEFYAARNAIGAELKLFATIKEGDLDTCRPSMTIRSTR